MRVVVRQATPDDAGPLIAHVQEMAAEPGANLLTGPGEFTLTVEQERQVIADYAASGNSIFLVAEDAGRIVGVLSCRGGTRKANRHAATLGITVSKDWRRQGVGAALMAGAVEWARQTGIVKRLELYVFVRNEAAVHLYQSFGFETEGLRRRVVFRDGGYLDDYIMAKLL
jgi:RimJ/RimL family protein N-acetyltransferase